MLPVYAITNSNREHKQYWSKQFSGILSNFKEVYVSPAPARIYLWRHGKSASMLSFMKDHVVRLGFGLS